MRKCVVTNERYPKNELIRIVRTPEKEVKVDLTGRLNGHGAYIKNDIALLDSNKMKDALSRALEMNVPDEFFEELKNVLKK